METDSMKLLRECDAGIQMGVDAIDEVIACVEDQKFSELLSNCKEKHEKLRMEIERMLDAARDGGKNPNPIAKGMSWVKTNMKLAMQESDATIADLMTDGCNMGVKSLHKYLNQYAEADEKTKDIAKRLINIEETLAVDIRSYL